MTAAAAAWRLCKNIFQSRQMVADAERRRAQLLNWVYCFLAVPSLPSRPAPDRTGAREMLQCPMKTDVSPPWRGGSSLELCPSSSRYLDTGELSSQQQLLLSAQRPAADFCLVSPRLRLRHQPRPACVVMLKVKTMFCHSSEGSH